MNLSTAQSRVEDLVYHFGRKVQHARLMATLKQEDMAKILGIKQQTVSKIETGGYVRNELLVAILMYADHYQISPSSLFFETPEWPLAALQVTERYLAADPFVQEQVKKLLA